MRMLQFRRFAALTALVAALPILTGCYTVPETGRRDMALLSSSEEMKMGFSEFEKMKKAEKINKDPQINAMVQRVGKRIAAVAELPDAQWEFVVFENDVPNAFCLPGGKIGIYTGILPITQSEEGLATVMGHEVAHAVARHGAARISRAMGVQMIGQILGQAVAHKSQRAQVLTMQAYGLGAQLGSTLPHSRLQESEADHIGLLYMARAGYDPQEAVAFWQRFADYNRKAGGNTPWFLRTHPLDVKRVERLQALMPEAKREYRPR